MPRFIQHILFWFGYMLYATIIDMAYYPDFWANFTLAGMQVPIFLLVCYFNLYVLLPKLFKRKKYWILSLINLFTIGIGAFIIISYLKLFFNLVEKPETGDFFYSQSGYFIFFTEITLMVSLTSAIKLGKQALNREKHLRELEQQKFEAEMSFFKQQINPHFVFNALNSIYFAIPKDKQMAQDIVMKISDMLSHQLYDSQKDFIALSNEVEYLRSYMDLEKIRHGDTLNLLANLPEEVPENLQIAPMLLLPFVENAFKYATTAQSSTYWVNISLKLEDKKLVFTCSNPFSSQHERTEHQKGGIGLENVKKRLGMIYPKSHELEIKQKSDVWEVKLILHYLSD